MTELFIPLFFAGAFLGPWVLDALRAPKSVAVSYGLLIIALGCLRLLGVIHLEVPKIWGVPAAIILMLGGMLGAARLLVGGLKSHQNVPR